jgi:hypothetical protein
MPTHIDQSSLVWPIFLDRISFSLIFSLGIILAAPANGADCVVKKTDHYIYALGSANVDILVGAQDGLYKLKEDASSGETSLSLIPGGDRLGEVFDFSETSDLTYIASERGLYTYQQNILAPLIISDRAIGEIYSVLASGDDLLVGSFRGLFRVQGKHLTKIDGADPGWVTRLAHDGKTIFVGGHFGAFRLVDNTLTDLNTWEMTGESYSFFREPGKILIGGQRGLFELADGKIRPLYTQELAGEVRAIVPIHGRVYTGIRDHVAQLLDEKALTVAAENDQTLGEIYSIKQIGERILVGSTTGVYELLSVALTSFNAQFENQQLSTDAVSHLYWRLSYRCALHQEVTLSSAQRNTAEVQEKTPVTRITAINAGPGRWVADLPPVREGNYEINVVATSADEPPTQIGSTSRSARIGGLSTKWISLIGGTVGLIVFGIGVTVWSTNWRLQRWLRLRFGSAWSFANGECNFEADIRHSAGLIQITVEDRSDARSAVLHFEIPEQSWPPPEAFREAAKAAIPKAATIRVEADASSFSRPWANIVGDFWSEAEARIGGQVCRVERLVGAGPGATKTLMFCGLSCVDDGVNPQLPTAAAEVYAVAQVFRSWGAGTLVFAADADHQAMQDALVRCDIVHVAAHASPSGLYLSDGMYVATDLASIDMRCRVLLLSACDIGNITEEKAFLWEVVRRGVNVIAATKPVDDAASRIFFEEFFQALLPRKHLGGVHFHEAVRAAILASHRRFTLSASRTGDSRAMDRWAATLDSFVLLGDPTLYLQLSPARWSGAR